MSRLKDKSILVTVDGNGLAPVVARAFVAEGARVVVAGADQAAVGKLVESVGGGCSAVVMDPSDAASCEQGVAKAVETLGGLDVVCNLAGTFPKTGRLHELAEADYDAAVKANITSVLLTTRNAIPAFGEDGEGTIITVSHSAALTGVQGTGLIAATKGALLNMTRCIDLQGAKKGTHRANCVCVGDPLVPVIPSQLEKYQDTAGAAEQLAPTFVYLASDESRQVRGQILSVDEGTTAWIPDDSAQGPAPKEQPDAQPGEGVGYMEGEVVLITAGGGGIAKATARLLASEGAKLAIADLSGDAAEATASEVREAGGEAIGLAGNALVGADCDRLVQETVAKYGKLTGLLNLVGLFGKGGQTLDKVDLSEWDLMMDLNLKSVFLMSKAAIPALIEGGGGAIVNTGTLAAVLARGGGGYGAPKSGVLALTRAMAADYFNDRVRVNAVCPSGVNTAMYRDCGKRPGMTPEKAQKRLDKARRSAQGLSEPEEIAPSFMFLASDRLSRKVTGHTLLVENGYSTIRR